MIVKWNFSIKVKYGVIGNIWFAGKYVKGRRKVIIPVSRRVKGTLDSSEKMCQVERSDSDPIKYIYSW